MRLPRRRTVQIPLQSRRPKIRVVYGGEYRRNHVKRSKKLSVLIEDWKMSVEKIRGMEQDKVSFLTRGEAIAHAKTLGVPVETKDSTARLKAKIWREISNACC